MRTIQLASALTVMLLTASPMKGQVLRDLLQDVQKGLQKEVDRELSSSAGERLRKAAEDILRGATISEAIGKQLQSATAAVAIQMTLLPPLDPSLTLANRNTLKESLTGPVRSLADRYAAWGMEEYCSQNERNCACLAGSALSQKIVDDLYKEVTKPGIALMLIQAEAGPEKVLAKLIVRVSVSLANQLVHEATQVIRSGQSPVSFCATLQAGGARLGPDQINHALDQSLQLVSRTP